MCTSKFRALACRYQVVGIFVDGDVIIRLVNRISSALGQLAGGTYKDLLVAGQSEQDILWVSMLLHSLGQFWL
jgi:hypothetical protein